MKQTKNVPRYEILLQKGKEYQQSRDEKTLLSKMRRNPIKDDYIETIGSSEIINAKIDLDQNPGSSEVENE